MNSLPEDLASTVHYLLKDPAVIPGFRQQFKPHERSSSQTARNLNAAFLIALTGKRLSHPAKGYLASMARDGRWGKVAGFYLTALELVALEWSRPGLEDLARAARDLVRHLDTHPDVGSKDSLERYWRIFFPEGVGLTEPNEQAVGDLRERRKVSIDRLNPAPVTRPWEQLLFTSNVLLTMPMNDDIDTLPLDAPTKEALKPVCLEEQQFWYDHPVPVGIESDRNEVVYGLTALDRAVAFEKGRGNMPDGARAGVLLSISTTHRGLQSLARDYLGAELEKAGGVSCLDIYAAAESDTREILRDVVLPAAQIYFPGRDAAPLFEVFGVDGEYGRHYSFLKGMAALWQVLIQDRTLGTFKIDLDQVFPQEELVARTGRSAFEHLSDPLWGAEGVDSLGRKVELGMIAGSLVNEGDIERGLFTPDTEWPSGPPSPDQMVFASPWPQALSTEAEMMARYGDGGPDGKTVAFQRVHVTGGTTGILIDSLRRHRPFTPSWIGRAEDQAYLLPVLFPEKGCALRYAHASGLIMRHDKESFAADAVKRARVGKMVGDYLRILDFTSLAAALPWGLDSIKGEIDPFTGCFVSRLPVTVSCLRMALAAAALFGAGSEDRTHEAEEIVLTGAVRLGERLGTIPDGKDVRIRLERQRGAWNLYYDVLDALEKGLARGDGRAAVLRERAIEVVQGWRLRPGRP